MIGAKASKGVWIGVWTISLAAAAGKSPCTAAEAPLVAVNSNHWGPSQQPYQGPFSTDVYGFNADGTSFPGWSGSYGALIGPGRWGIPLPDQSSSLSRAEGIIDVSYANGSLYVTTFMMGAGDVFQVNPQTGVPTARIGIGSQWDVKIGRNSYSFQGIPWVPSPISQIPGYADFAANDINWNGPLLTVGWIGVLSAPQSGPDGALFFSWEGWWQGVVYQDGWQNNPVAFYGGLFTGDAHREILRYIGDPLHPGSGAWDTLIPDVPSFSNALLVTPDNRLLLTAPDGIRAYDATSGQFLNTLVLTGEGGLSNPTGLILGNGDTLFVANQDTDQVLRFDSHTGAFLGPLNLLNFQLLNDPLDLDFLDGNRDTLLVSQRQSPYLVRISHVNGPGPALATPFTPFSESLFGPVENSMSIAVIPESSSGPLLAGVLVGTVAGLWYRRRRPGQ